MKPNEFKNKNILILGFGKEGKDSFLFFRKLFPKKIIGIADESEKIKRPDKKSKMHLGKDYLRSLKNYRVIIKSPGIPPKKIAPFLNKKQSVTSQTEIFFDNCPAKIIGVTGSKGKGTTASIIYQVLKKNGFKAYLIGNIGKPALKFLLSAKKENIYVYELSSHQLYNLKKSPHIAVFLNLFEEHLDYYRNFKEYAQAKANIALFQKKKDYLIYNSKNKFIKKIAEKSAAVKIPMSSVSVKLPISKKLLSPQNIMAALAAARIFKIADKKIIQALKEFKPLPHRLEKVGTFQGITFYNDSAATMPEATIAAIEALGNRLETVILGGSDKDLSFDKLAKRILQSKIKTIILIPSTGEKIKQAIVRQNKKNRYNKKLKYFSVSNRASGLKCMKEAVDLAFENTLKNKICLLSPASASFGIFKNYKERGTFFEKRVFASQKRR